jgi:hypothetical protein
MAEGATVDTLSAIEVSAVDKLVEIKKDQALLDEYRSKAESIKAKTSDSVYSRVLADYEKRRMELDTQAAPLQAGARREYHKLRSIFDELNTAHEAACLNKEEIEFRQAVGELQKEEAEKRLPKAQWVLKKCKKELAEVDRLRARFLEVLTAEDESGPQQEEPETKKPVEVELGVDMSDATMLMPPGASLPDAAALDAETDPASSQVENGSKDATVMVPPGILISDLDNAIPTEHALGAISGIGRGEENQIVVSEGGVSLKHALLTADLTGFTLKDLKSRNGTFVNDERITECSVSDGDCIRLGDIEMIFRST